MKRTLLFILITPYGKIHRVHDDGRLPAAAGEFDSGTLTRSYS